MTVSQGQCSRMWILKKKNYFEDLGLSCADMQQMLGEEPSAIPLRGKELYRLEQRFKCNIAPDSETLLGFVSENSTLGSEPRKSFGEEVEGGDEGSYENSTSSCDHKIEASRMTKPGSTTVLPPSDGMSHANENPPVINPMHELEPRKSNDEVGDDDGSYGEISQNVNDRKIIASEPKPESPDTEQKSISGSVSDRQTEQKKWTWDANFSNLKTYMKQRYPNGGFVAISTNQKLYSWVRKQRYLYRLTGMGDTEPPKISNDEVQRLEAIGFHREKKDEASLKRPPIEEKNLESREARKRRKISSDTFEQPKTRHIPNRRTPTETSLKSSSEDRASRNMPESSHGRPEARKSSKSHKEQAWDAQFEKLSRHMQKHYPNGGYVVSSMSDRKLGTWIRRQRQCCRMRLSGAHSPMSDDRFERLQAIGFQWEIQVGNESMKSREQSSDHPGSAAGLAETYDQGWESKFEKLRRHMKKHYPNGGFVRTSMSDKKLANWIQRQRRDGRTRLRGTHSPMSDDKFERLQAIGFQWENSVNKSKKSTEIRSDHAQEGAATGLRETNIADDSDSEYYDCIAEETDSIVGNSGLESQSWVDLFHLCANQRMDIKRLKLNESASRTQLNQQKEEIKLLHDMNQDLVKTNAEMMDCNQNLRNSHRTAMLEERAHITREWKMREIVEEKLKTSQQESKETIQKLRSEKMSLKSTNAKLTQENTVLLARNHELEKRLESLERHNRRVESPSGDAAENHHSKKAGFKMTPSSVSPDISDKEGHDSANARMRRKLRDLGKRRRTS